MKYLKQILLLVILLFTLTLFPVKVFSLDCDTSTNINGLSGDDLNQFISLCQHKVSDLQNQASSLSSEIQLMDTKIYLTVLQIHETENKIKETADEIDTLTGRIEGLNGSLDTLTKLLLKKIVEGYKRHDVPFLDTFLDSNTASTLLNRLKYAKATQENDQRTAIQLQEAKLNYEKQKDLREQKKVTLDQLNQTLTEQKNSLDSQKVAKQKLLADTQNSETVYQNLLAQAQAQLAEFRSFVKGSGASSTIAANAFGNGSDGAYYSQRDERWASKTIGLSSENILDVGCLVSSVAMVATHYGQNSTPADIGGNSSRFWANTAYMNNPWPGVAGRSYHSLSTSEIDQELQNGNYVIVGVGGCSYGGSHFVVLTKKDGGDYIMHDPIYGPDLKFSSHYSNICSAATFK